MFDCSRGRCAKYFGDVYTSVHRCCTFDGDLIVPRVWSTRFGCRSFRVCGPTIWNKFPQDLPSTDTKEQFKRSHMHTIRVCIWQEARDARLQMVTEGVPYKWTSVTYFLTYFLSTDLSAQSKAHLDEQFL